MNEVRWLTDISEIPGASVEELRRSLITPDGRGPALKRAALDELLARTVAEKGEGIAELDTGLSPTKVFTIYGPQGDCFGSFKGATAVDALEECCRAPAVPVFKNWEQMQVILKIKIDRVDGNKVYLAYLEDVGNERL